MPSDEKRLTKANFDSWRFNRNAIHLNGGKVFFGNGHRCVDQPRLVVIDKFFKKDRSTKRSYFIDGKTECATLEEALILLQHPPQLSAENRALLETVSDEWFKHENRIVLYELGEMGLIEWQRKQEGVFCRRTEAGRSALNQMQAGST